jgi:hypothetical protein
MIRGLKVVMIIWGAIGILFGLGFVFAPDQLSSMYGYAKGPAYVQYILTSLGICYLIPSVFVIIAAVRDPLKNIMWAQMATAFPVLMLIISVYSLIRGFVTFRPGWYGHYHGRCLRCGFPCPVSLACSEAVET